MKALMTIAMMTLMTLMTLTAQAGANQDPALTKGFDLVQVQREEKAAYKAFLQALGENADDREVALKRMDMDETSETGELRIVLKPQG